MEVVRQLVGAGEVARIGGRTETLSVLFTDIAGFTSIAEGMTPQALATRPWSLQRYTEIMPIQDPQAAPSLGEGGSPLHAVPRLAEAFGVGRSAMREAISAWRAISTCLTTTTTLDFTFDACDALVRF